MHCSFVPEHGHVWEPIGTWHYCDQLCCIAVPLPLQNEVAYVTETQYYIKKKKPVEKFI